MRYFFRVEYDGTTFGGWQSQPHTSSIQETLSKAFSLITRQTCTVQGAGRTDAGVHARGQGAHVDISADIDTAKCQHSVNAVLPREISIYHLQTVPPDFHARYSAKRRRYRYSLTSRKSPLLYNRAWPIFQEIDWALVRHTIPQILGKHDFSAFCASGSSAKTKFCTIFNAELCNTPEGHTFVIEADRFLYTMVRTIVGTLIAIGRKKISLPLSEIITKGDRTLAGDTAPACGLVLDYVEYEGID